MQRTGIFRTMIIAASVLLSQPIQAGITVPDDELKRQDLRVAMLAERMFAANASLCRQQMPLTGLLLHSRDQYPPAEAEARFGEAIVGVALVVPGSAAEQAGIAPGHRIDAIGGKSIRHLRVEEDGLFRDAAFDALASGGSITFTRDNERPVTVSLNAAQGCRGLVEIRLRQQFGARTDGRIIQLDYGLVTRTNESALAVAFAHEFAHVVLEHRRRLQNAGVVKGFFGEFGRNARLARQMEVEADLLSLHLLANAGFSAQSAPSFWRSDIGREVSGGILRSRAYPSAEGRAEAMDREIAAHIVNGRSDGAEHLLRNRDEMPELE